LYSLLEVTQQKHDEQQRGSSGYQTVQSTHSFMSALQADPCGQTKDKTTTEYNAEQERFLPGQQQHRQSVDVTSYPQQGYEEEGQHGISDAVRSRLVNGLGLAYIDVSSASTLFQDFKTNTRTTTELSAPLRYESLI